VKGRHSKSSIVKVTLCQHSFEASIDNGATINVISHATFSKMTGIKLQKTNTRAFSFNTPNPVEFLGKFVDVVETRKGDMTTATFYVVKPSPGNNNTSNLISLQTAQELGLVSLHINKITTGDTAFGNTVNKHDKVFNGLGCLKADPIKLSINEQHPPKAQPMRRIPYHMRKKVEDTLQNLEQERIIERIPENEGTPWVSPIVVVPKKDGHVWICVDMRLANEAIERVQHPILTVDDVRFALNGAQFFTKLDLQQAYHQLPLHESSRYITTFNTYVGLFRYQRLAYGINASAEIFQYALQTQLQGLKGVKNKFTLA